MKNSTVIGRFFLRFISSVVLVCFVATNTATAAPMSKWDEQWGVGDGTDAAADDNAPAERVWLLKRSQAALEHSAEKYRKNAKRETAYDSVLRGQFEVSWPESSQAASLGASNRYQAGKTQLTRWVLNAQGRVQNEIINEIKTETIDGVESPIAFARRMVGIVTELSGLKDEHIDGILTVLKKTQTDRAIELTLKPSPNSYSDFLDKDFIEAVAVLNIPRNTSDKTQLPLLKQSVASASSQKVQMKKMKEGDFVNSSDLALNAVKIFVKEYLQYRMNSRITVQEGPETDELDSEADGASLGASKVLRIARQMEDIKRPKEPSPLMLKFGNKKSGLHMSFASALKTLEKAGEFAEKEVRRIEREKEFRDLRRKAEKLIDEIGYSIEENASETLARIIRGLTDGNFHDDVSLIKYRALKRLTERNNAELVNYLDFIRGFVAATHSNSGSQKQIATVSKHTKTLLQILAQKRNTPQLEAGIYSILKEGLRSYHNAVLVEAIAVFQEDADRKADGPYLEEAARILATKLRTEPIHSSVTANGRQEVILKGLKFIKVVDANLASEVFEELKGRRDIVYVWDPNRLLTKAKFVAGFTALGAEIAAEVVRRFREGQDPSATGASLGRELYRKQADHFQKIEQASQTIKKCLDELEAFIKLNAKRLNRLRVSEQKKITHLQNLISINITSISAVFKAVAPHHPEPQQIAGMYQKLKQDIAGRAESSWDIHTDFKFFSEYIRKTRELLDHVRWQTQTIRHITIEPEDKWREIPNLIKETNAIDAWHVIFENRNDQIWVVRLKDGLLAGTVFYVSSLGLLIDREELDEYPYAPTNNQRIKLEIVKMCLKELYAKALDGTLSTEKELATNAAADYFADTTLNAFQLEKDPQTATAQENQLAQDLQDRLRSVEIMKRQISESSGSSLGTGARLFQVSKKFAYMTEEEVLKLVQTAQEYQSQILLSFLRKKDAEMLETSSFDLKNLNTESLTGYPILSGSEILLKTEGEDAKEAMEAVSLTLSEIGITQVKPEDMKYFPGDSESMATEIFGFVPFHIIRSDYVSNVKAASRVFLEILKRAQDKKPAKSLLTKTATLEVGGKKFFIRIMPGKEWSSLVVKDNQKKIIFVSGLFHERGRRSLPGVEVNALNANVIWGFHPAQDRVLFCVDGHYYSVNSEGVVELIAGASLGWNKYWKMAKDYGKAVVDLINGRAEQEERGRPHGIQLEISKLDRDLYKAVKDYFTPSVASPISYHALGLRRVSATYHADTIESYLLLKLYFEGKNKPQEVKVPVDIVEIQGIPERSPNFSVLKTKFGKSLGSEDEEEEAPWENLPPGPLKDQLIANKTRPVSAVFQGGGAKGTAYVGALQAMKDKNYWFNEVVGTSAGAITTALIAVGYTSDEIKDIVFETDFNEFKDWRWGIVPPVLNLLAFGGLYRGIVFERWLAKKLKDKLGFEPTLSDLPIPLTVIASDISNKELLVLNEKSAPDLKVSEAVRMSMGIPFFYEVFRWFGSYNKSALIKRRVVDGGLLSNFGIFAVEKTIYPVIGFTLKEVAHKKTVLAGLIGFFLKLLNLLPFIHILAMVEETSLEAWDNRHIEEDTWANIIDIPVNVGTTDFNLTKKQKEDLERRGYEATIRHLPKLFPGTSEADDRSAYQILRRINIIQKLPPEKRSEFQKAFLNGFKLKKGSENLVPISSVLGEVRGAEAPEPLSILKPGVLNSPASKEQSLIYYDPKVFLGSDKDDSYYFKVRGNVFALARDGDVREVKAASLGHVGLTGSPQGLSGAERAEDKAKKIFEELRAQGLLGLKESLGIFEEQTDFLLEKYDLVRKGRGRLVGGPHGDFHGQIAKVIGFFEHPDKVKAAWDRVFNALQSQEEQDPVTQNVTSSKQVARALKALEILRQSVRNASSLGASELLKEFKTKYPANHEDMLVWFGELVLKSDSLKRYFDKLMLAGGSPLSETKAAYLMSLLRIEPRGFRQDEYSLVYDVERDGEEDSEVIPYEELSQEFLDWAIRSSIPLGGFGLAYSLYLKKKGELAKKYPPTTKMRILYGRQLGNELLAEFKKQKTVSERHPLLTYKGEVELSQVRQVEIRTDAEMSVVGAKYGIDLSDLQLGVVQSGDDYTFELFTKNPEILEAAGAISDTRYERPISVAFAYLQPEKDAPLVTAFKSRFYLPPDADPFLRQYVDGALQILLLALEKGAPGMSERPYSRIRFVSPGYFAANPSPFVKVAESTAQRFYSEYPKRLGYKLVVLEEPIRLSNESEIHFVYEKVIGTGASLGREDLVEKPYRDDPTPDELKARNFAIALHALIYGGKTRSGADYEGLVIARLKLKRAIQEGIENEKKKEAGVLAEVLERIRRHYKDIKITAVPKNRVQSFLEKLRQTEPDRFEAYRPQLENGSLFETDAQSAEDLKIRARFLKREINRFRPKFQKAYEAGNEKLLHELNAEIRALLTLYNKIQLKRTLLFLEDIDPKSWNTRAAEFLLLSVRNYTKRHELEVIREQIRNRKDKEHMVRTYRVNLEEFDAKFIERAGIDPILRALSLEGWDIRRTSDGRFIIPQNRWIKDQKTGNRQRKLVDVSYPDLPTAVRSQVNTIESQMEEVELILDRIADAEDILHHIRGHRYRSIPQKDIKNSLKLLVHIKDWLEAGDVDAKTDSARLANTAEESLRIQQFGRVESSLKIIIKNLEDKRIREIVRIQNRVGARLASLSRVLQKYESKSEGASLGTKAAEKMIESLKYYGMFFGQFTPDRVVFSGNGFLLAASDGVLQAMALYLFDLKTKRGFRLKVPSEGYFDAIGFEGSNVYLSLIESGTYLKKRYSFDMSKIPQIDYQSHLEEESIDTVISSMAPAFKDQATKELNGLLGLGFTNQTSTANGRLFFVKGDAVGGRLFDLKTFKNSPYFQNLSTNLKGKDFVYAVDILASLVEAGLIKNDSDFQNYLPLVYRVSHLDVLRNALVQLIYYGPQQQVSYFAQRGDPNGLAKILQLRDEDEMVSAIRDYYEGLRAGGDGKRKGPAQGLSLGEVHWDLGKVRKAFWSHEEQANFYLDLNGLSAEADITPAKMERIKALKREIATIFLAADKPHRLVIYNAIPGHPALNFFKDLPNYQPVYGNAEKAYQRFGKLGINLSLSIEGVDPIREFGAVGKTNSFFFRYKSLGDAGMALLYALREGKPRSKEVDYLTITDEALRGFVLAVYQEQILRIAA